MIIQMSDHTPVKLRVTVDGRPMNDAEFDSWLSASPSASAPYAGPAYTITRANSELYDWLDDRRDCFTLIIGRL